MTKRSGSRARTAKAAPPAPAQRRDASAASAAAAPQPASRRLSDLLPRAVSSLVLMAAALSSVWLGGESFAFIWLIAAFAIVYEWQSLIVTARLIPRLLIAGFALVLAGQFAGRGGVGLACYVVALGALAAATIAGQGRRVWAFAGVAYAGALLVSITALFHSPALGAKSILWLFAAVWGTDVFAYFGGRLVGGPKLWSKISPSKTWSGTLIGALAGALIGAAIGVGAESGSLGVEAGLGLGAAGFFGLGLVIALVSQAGDLFESWVKRRFGVKDSSVLIPGHGGFMDRLDGFIAAATFAALVAASRHLL